MDELVEWLHAQVDEDERVAMEARCGGEGRWHQTDPDREAGRIEDERGEVVTYDEGSPSEHQAEHMVLHDPARVLREVEAKRRILDAYEKALDRRRLFRDDVASAGALLQMVAVVELLALPYSDRPGRPSTEE
jgi:hypothetical protein